MERKSTCIFCAKIVENINLHVEWKSDELGIFFNNCHFTTHRRLPEKRLLHLFLAQQILD